MKINYPVPLNKVPKVKVAQIKVQSKEKTKIFRTQGMLFENELNASNEYYNLKGIALIHKKPTPIQVVRVDYPSRNRAKIVEAYYKIPSTTDYNGIYKGKYIDYEAKETIKSYFPFAHIRVHQIEHLVKVNHLGGIAFIIIYFRITNEIVLIDINDFYHLYKNCTRKSITIDQAKNLGKVIIPSYGPSIDYLKIIDELYKV